MFEIINEIKRLLSRVENKLHFFIGKNYANRDNYPIDFCKWTEEVTVKNRIIYENKGYKDREKARRRRGQVFWIDFGMNIGSEFNDYHFCVVVKESLYTAIVVPLSSVKENTPDWKFSEELIKEIGEINGLPDKRQNYALINQIRAVSKQRLSTFQYNGQYLKLKLKPEQMDIIDQGLLLLCKH